MAKSRTKLNLAEETKKLYTFCPEKRGNCVWPAAQNGMRGPKISQAN
ncbi:MAG: hypothetical protein OP8BY_2124 [Candidatus Saccharicenans subterraneus]|uniref:Uncharacterized protein n=1 Tax=Candidatus Saccharicenans subterraneus TaxID=2508984 RepID=A0A3E2BN19_9BACT|nr:MAG: hypothetical protein OP8BY_2124 [Candidatus Saccharicenans subterraneum]